MNWDQPYESEEEVIFVCVCAVGEGSGGVKVVDRHPSTLLTHHPFLPLPAATLIGP